MFNFCNTPYRKRQHGYMYGVIELEQVAWGSLACVAGGIVY